MWVLNDSVMSNVINIHFYRASYALRGIRMSWSCVCVSVCVCLSQVEVLLKRLNIGTRKQRCMFSDAKNLFEIERGHPQRGHQMQVG